MVIRKKSYILRIIAFLLLGNILFFITSHLLIPKWYYPDATLKEPTGRVLTGIYAEEPMSLDVVFCGTSHILYGAAPMELYERYGIKSYVLSSPCQSASMTYYLLKEASKTQSPKVFVYDASSLYQGNGSEIYWRYPLDCMPLSKNKYDAAKTFSDAFDQVTLLDALSPFYNYHTRWASLDKLDFTDFSRNRHLYTKGGFIDSEMVPAPSIEEMLKIP